MVLGVARTAGVTPVRRHQGLSCILFQPAPTDPQQDTAEPSTQGGGTSRKTYLRKGGGGRVLDRERRREQKE